MTVAEQALSPAQLAAIGGFVLGLVAALGKFGTWLWEQRKTAIAANYVDLASSWTNEGVVIGESDEHTVHLDLALEDGDLYGQVRCTSGDEVYEIHVNPGWFSSVATVTWLRGRSLFPIGKVQLKLTGNRNRLQWKILRAEPGAQIADKATMWRHPGKAVL